MYDLHEMSWAPDACVHGPMEFPASLVKAGVHLNLIEILGSLKRDWNGGKRLWNTTRQLPNPTMAHQVVGQLFGVYLPTFNFKL